MTCKEDCILEANLKGEDGNMHPVRFYKNDFKFYDPFEIKDINIIVPNKVVEVTFEGGGKKKSVCREPDVFSLEQAITICLCKEIMGGSGHYNNVVKKGLKVYENKLKKIEEEKIEQERIVKKKAKRQAYMERKKIKKEQAEKERAIEIQKEAYIRAFQEIQPITKENETKTEDVKEAKTINENVQD